MFYQLKYDMDLVDKVIEKKKRYIYGDSNNINDIEFQNYSNDSIQILAWKPMKRPIWKQFEIDIGKQIPDYSNLKSLT